MAAYSTIDSWVAAQGGGGTAVNFHGTPSVGVPSSVLNSAILDAGLLTGWKVFDLAGRMSPTSLVDNGSYQTLIALTGGVEFFYAHGYLGAAGVVWPTRLVGDFELIALVSGAVNGVTTTQLGLIAANGTATSRCGAEVLRYGRWNASADFTAYAPAGTMTSTMSAGAGLFPWATPRWLRLARSGEQMIASHGGTGGTPAWTDVLNEPWQFAGARPHVGFFWHSGNALDEVRFHDVQLTGTEAA